MYAGRRRKISNFRFSKPDTVVLRGARAEAGGLPRKVCGETDMTGCEEVGQFLGRCREAMETDCPALSLDLSGVRAADSKLVACLVLVHQAAWKDKVGLSVTTSETVQKLIGIYRLDRILGSGLAERGRAANPDGGNGKKS